MLYFSYGSNMSIRRLQARTPSARLVGSAVLRQYRLMFHKYSENDGSGKCDAEQIGNPNHAVIGVVFEIAMVEKALLDRFEGLGYGYDEKSVTVEMLGGGTLQALTYYATRTRSGLQPFHWYKEHVLTGARENGLPDEYIQTIAAVTSIADPNPQRHAHELQIYR